MWEWNMKFQVVLYKCVQESQKRESVSQRLQLGGGVKTSPFTFVVNLSKSNIHRVIHGL